mgnify:CR=1 FL=1
MTNPESAHLDVAQRLDAARAKAAVLRVGDAVMAGRMPQRDRLASTSAGQVLNHRSLSRVDTDSTARHNSRHLTHVEEI